MNPLHALKQIKALCELYPAENRPTTITDIMRIAESTINTAYTAAEPTCTVTHFEGGKLKVVKLENQGASFPFDFR